MTTQNEFICRVSRALGRKSLPEKPIPPSLVGGVHERVMQSLPPDRLAHAFMEYSRTIGATVVSTRKASLNDSLAETIERWGGGACLLADQPLFRELRTAAFLQSRFPVDIWDPNIPRSEAVERAERAAVGIAVAECALAESATVMLFSSPGLGRSVTLLPPAAISVIPQSAILPRWTQAMELIRAAKKQEMPSSINFVSGPSATSDIELVRVVGVHGPMRVAHVVVEDL